jgi:hypothetical protein
MFLLNSSVLSLIVIFCVTYSKTSYSLTKNEIIAKQNIIALASKNTTNVDDFEEIRTILSNYIKILAKSKSNQKNSFNSRLGAWRQLWTDDNEDLKANNFFQQTDRMKNYQIIFDNQLFYNFIGIDTIVGPFSGFIRASYEKNKDGIDLEFNRIRLKQGDMVDERELVDFARLLETGKIEGTFGVPFVSDKYPDGPVGAKGDLVSIYIDDDIRIESGANDADGIVDLFIFEKVADL